MTDPHEDDYCVVCKRGPEHGGMMHPIKTITDGYVCGKCVTDAEYELPWGVANNDHSGRKPEDTGEAEQLLEDALEDLE